MSAADVLAAMDHAAELLGDDAYRADMLRHRAAVDELIEAATRANELVNLLTVRQVIEAGDKAIDAAGLNPYCMAEGLADGSESIGFWLLDTALARVTGAQS